MGKAVFLAVMLTQYVMGIIPSGTEIAKEFSYSSALIGYMPFEGNSYRCVEDVVYVEFGRGGAVSYNPLTKEPYYCAVQTTTQKVDYGVDKVFYKMKILHTYEELLAQMKGKE